MNALYQDDGVLTHPREIKRPIRVPLDSQKLAETQLLRRTQLTLAAITAPRGRLGSLMTLSLFVDNSGYEAFVEKVFRCLVAWLSIGGEADPPV